MARLANDEIENLCPNDNHSIRKSAEICDICHAILCSLCGTDKHYTSQGHDLNNPAYWGI